MGRGEMNVHKRKERFYFHPSWSLFRKFVRGEKISVKSRKRFLRHLAYCDECREERLLSALDVWFYKLTHHNGRITRSAEALRERHLTEKEIKSFAENRLSPEKRRELGRHLGICQVCFNSLEAVLKEGILAENEEVVLERTKRELEEVFHIN